MIFLGSSFPEEACQDCPDGCSWVSIIPKRSLATQNPNGYQNKENIFALSVMLKLIFHLLQVHIIPRDTVDIAMGYSNDNLVKKLVQTLPNQAILKHNFHSMLWEDGKKEEKRKGQYSLLPNKGIG